MRRYQYRDLPIRDLKDRPMPWAVGGEDLVRNTFGILEWCFDLEDAEEIRSKMQTSGEFRYLSIREV